MKITDYVIDIEGSTLGDRLRLRQVLLDNNQQIFSQIEKNEYNTRSGRVLMCSEDHFGEWAGTNKKLPNITLEDFIQKFKKNDEVRGLAFYKKYGTDWNIIEGTNIQRFCGDSTSEIELHKQGFIYDDDCVSPFMYPWRSQDKKILNKCIKVAYEDVFSKESLNIDYWEAKYKAGEDVWVELKCGSIVKCGKLSPKKLTSPKVFYDYNPTLTQQEEKPTKTHLDTQEKEIKMDNTLLKLLVELMQAPETKDATNSKYVGILSSEDGEYLGYIYFDEKEEAETIMQKPENEGTSLNYFKYKGTLCQKPREIIETVRDLKKS